MKFSLNPIFLTTALSLSISCGTNAFESSETSDPAEDATIALENDDPDAAIELLEDALDNDATNPIYISVLSLAYAQRAGVEPLTFAQNFAEKSSESEEEEGSNQFTVMFDIMPEPTTTILSDIDMAVTLINSIPVADRLSGDDFKLAMFNTASVVLATKAFDADGDGDLSLDELTDLSDAGATALLAKITAAESLLGSDSDNADDAESFSQFRTSLDSQEGDTDEDKLKNLLASSEETE
jgi:hypothetical protein